MDQKKHSPFDIISAFVLFAIVVVITAQIIWRYVFNNSLSWSEELSRFLFAWLIFVGAALAVRENTHIKVDLFYNMYGTSTKRVIDLVLYALIIFVQGYFFVFSVEFIIKTHGTYSTAMQLPMNMVVYPSLAVGCLLSIYFSVRGIFATLKRSA